MVDEPENLVLALMREMRREIAAAMEAVNTSMKATHRVYAHLERFNNEMAGVRAEMGSLRAEMGALKTEVAEFRSETARHFVRLESDLIHLENQNMSRHGETLHAFRRIAELERQPS